MSNVQANGNFKKSLIATVLLSIIHAPVMANEPQQEQTQSEKKQFEVIEVTAQKRSQSINEVPMSISAFNAETLDEIGIDDTTDLANIVPGFNFSDSAFGAPVYTLRGVGFNESSAQATSTVGVYVDEIAVPFPIMTKGTNLDVERVEILKGPQGTLYGRNSTAGAVNYIAAKPSKDFEAAIKAGVASYETISAEGYVTGGISDMVSGRLALKTIQSDEGWQESISRDETLGRQDRLAVRGSLNFDFSEATQALLTIGYASDNSETIAPQNIDYIPGKAGGAPFTVSIYQTQLDMAQNPQNFTGLMDDNAKADWTAGRTPSLEHTSTNVSLKVEHDINDQTLFTSLTGYSKFEDDGSEYERAGFAGETIANIKNNPLSAATEQAFGAGFDGYLLGRYQNAADSEYVTMDYVYQNGEIDSISQEFRVSQQLDSLVWIAGLYYSKSEVDYQTQQDWGISSNVNILPIPGFGFNIAENDINQQTTTASVFASADWFITDQFTLTTGLRYSKDEADFTGCSRDVDGGLADTFFNFFFGTTPTSDVIKGDGYNAGSCVTVLDFGTPEASVGEVSDTLSEDSLSWRLAANYEFNDDLSVYASYSRGFKAGSFPSLAAVTDQQLVPVVQEQLDAYEIGFKSSLAERTLQLNGAAFYYDYQDKQLLTKKIAPVFNTVFTLGNMPKSSITGVELDGRWLATDNLTLGAAYGWLDSQIKQGVGYNQPGQYLDFKGSPLPFTPEHQFNLFARFDFEISAGLQGFVGADVAYSSESHADFEGSVDQTLAVSDFVGEPYAVEIPATDYEFDERFINPSYTLVNLRFGVEADSWKAFAWGKNITDEYYTNTTVKNNEMYAKYPAMGAQYGVTFEYTWF
ncbi:TonB-dependent receptor [Shewanella sp. 10N.286.48.B5]|uniref:TonB-dependent receptor n=1 Tax=Shewanella sp. 10N.286.48.B5 TaxID=1880834 RepID=UPI000C83ECC0|nr:TonB-dependent receptor [Shewanella sp. 10N.286.48.B5]PMH87860.1 hypothetical protein BCU57_01030 [Shewanella sp. 10N.286.48.B5]